MSGEDHGASGRRSLSGSFVPFTIMTPGAIILSVSFLNRWRRYAEEVSSVIEEYALRYGPTYYNPEWETPDRHLTLSRSETDDCIRPFDDVTTKRDRSG